MKNKRILINGGGITELTLAYWLKKFRFELTLISAPAGYGKTCLLAGWARASSLPVAWLSVTQEEDDIERFLRYLLAAWETLQPEIVETPLGILLGSQLPGIKAMLSAYFNAADQAVRFIWRPLQFD